MMNRTQTRVGAPWPRRVLSAAVVASVMVALSACAGGGGGTGGQSTDGAQSDCGTIAVLPANDPDNLMSTLPQTAQDLLNGYQDAPLAASEWADFAGFTEPISAGFVGAANPAPWLTAVQDTLRSHFEDGKAAGQFTGDFDIRQPADPSTQTDADVIRLYQDMVSEGRKLIFLLPTTGGALADAVTEAGKQGVVTVVLAIAVPSPYAINVVPNSYLMAAEPFSRAMSILGGKGTMLEVEGIAGYGSTQVYQNAIDTLLENCPDIKRLGPIYGGFTTSSSKSEVSAFLAANPGQIDAAIQLTVMGAGVWSAFKDSGRPTPLIIDVASSAASLAYWNDAIPDGYQGVGSESSGVGAGDIFWRAAEKVVKGDGPLVNSLAYQLGAITNDNIDEYLVPGADTSSTDDVLVPTSAFTDEQMNAYFSK